MVNIPDSDITIEWFSGTGAGGQYRNKHQNSCRVTHIPTGIVATSQHRSRQNNLTEAKAVLYNRVFAMTNGSHNKAVSSNRKQQVGTGMRGDKIRTYRFQDDRVQDHITGKTTSCDKIMKGYFDLVW